MLACIGDGSFQMTAQVGGRVVRWVGGGWVGGMSSAIHAFRTILGILLLGEWGMPPSYDAGINRHLSKIPPHQSLSSLWVQEVSTMLRYGTNPIILLINNGASLPYQLLGGCCRPACLCA